MRETHQYIREEVKLPLMRETHQYIGEEVVTSDEGNSSICASSSSRSPPRLFNDWLNAASL